MKLLARVAIGVWFLMLVYLGYAGVTDKRIENDSRIYHIPIAESVVTGRVITGMGYESPFSFYPGASEVILAGFVWMGIPINLFNVVGWVILTLGVRKLAVRAGVSANGAIIIGVAISMLPTVLRLPLTQLVDIWLAVWWIAWIYLLEEPKKSLSWWVKLGFVGGMVVGTKILGPILILISLIFYGKNLVKSFEIKKIGVAAFLVLIFGGWWYIRNWIIKGNPVFPLDFLGFKGDSGSQLPIVWKFLIWDKGALGMFFQALGSEFLIVAGSFVSFIKIRNKWIWLGIFNALIFFILPGSPGTIVSNCRYLIPAIIPLVIGIYKWVEEKRLGEWWSLLVVLNSIAVLAQFDYKPKLIIIALGLWGSWLLVKYRKATV